MTPYSPPPQPVETLPQTAYCVVSAAHRFKLPPEAVLVVLLQEDGEIGMKKSNGPGKDPDHGPMQVNGIWLGEKSPLKGYITSDALANDLCLNIHSGAWIIASYFVKSKNIWGAIGQYHAPYNRSLATKYVYQAYAKLPKARTLLKNNPYYQYYLGVYYPVQD